ncbi:hypothetical protein GCM10010218_10500 [Streptomyces mashuensis]|uniref:Small hydrophilic protein n=1 Tax=Streptomyces mashuensis TaxID=33904 RepID=A0A919AY98_9ACTN|nr:hypothetical protein [Streptomyces mashuensis]GHF31587.1 hypothetical protein GCM10010218_10500 [Streptomyces mashuensis]
MAKNKDRKQQKSSTQSSEKARSSAMESQSKSAVQPTPGDVARKHRERRFGHN